MRLIITRPIDDAKPLAEQLHALGVSSLLEPLLFIDYLDGPRLQWDGVQGLLLTSANSVRALVRRDNQRHIAVYAVGDASARAAREAGFTHVKSAAGDVDALAALVRQNLDADKGSLLHVAGSRVAGDLKGMLAKNGFEYRREVLYQARKADNFSAPTVSAIVNGDVDGVVLFSPRTADTFAELAAKARLVNACKGMTAFCLSPMVASKIENMPWHAIIIAAIPQQASLLEKIKEEMDDMNEFET